MPKAKRLSSLEGQLSLKAKRRLEWIYWYRANGSNARKTCRHFSISPDTFYRWLRRYDPNDLTTLEDRNRRPKRIIQPSWNPELAQAVLKLREQCPRWGKDKLVVLLRAAGWTVSTSMVERILKRAKQTGLLRELAVTGISARKRPRSRPDAVRKPREYTVSVPGGAPRNAA